MDEPNKSVDSIWNIFPLLIINVYGGVFKNCTSKEVTRNM
jgi:hypothetical protein